MQFLHVFTPEAMNTVYLEVIKITSAVKIPREHLWNESLHLTMLKNLHIIIF